MFAHGIWRPLAAHCTSLVFDKTAVCAVDHSFVGPNRVDYACLREPSWKRVCFGQILRGNRNEYARAKTTKSTLAAFRGNSTSRILAVTFLVKFTGRDRYGGSYGA
jgi:hypothetical protein